MSNPYSNVYGPGVTRFATDWAQQQDEFTADAETFGMAVPPTYGCISGCKVCRTFRNDVRAERARRAYEAGPPAPSYYDAEGNPPCGGDWDCDGTCRIDPPAKAPLTVEPAVFDRIANALELIAERMAL